MYKHIHKNTDTQLLYPLPNGTYIVPEGWREYDPKNPPAEISTIEVKKAHAAKYSEILSKSDAMCALIEDKYSQLEIKRFPEQQTGAEAILAGKSEPQRAVQLVKSLAAADGVTDIEFAQRIMNNVQQADMASTAILTQQRAYEVALKAAGDDVRKIEAITVNYTLG